MNRAAGLTLVEVLVAMTLVLVVLSGAVTFITRGRAAHRTGESIARLFAKEGGLVLATDIQFEKMICNEFDNEYLHIQY